MQSKTNYKTKKIKNAKQKQNTKQQVFKKIKRTKKQQK